MSKTESALATCNRLLKVLRGKTSPAAIAVREELLEIQELLTNEHVNQRLRVLSRETREIGE